MKARNEITGRQVLAILIGAFAAVIAANAVFITLAVRTFPGEEEKKSYLQGLAYNERLAERDAQARLGWSAELARFERAGDSVYIDLVFLKQDQSPIAGLAVSGTLARPASAETHPLAFHEVAPGRYHAALAVGGAGSWRLDATAATPDGDLFRLQKRMALP
jgi:nitrogen fixation protein FixH